MKREPSIHISEKDLKSLLQEAFKETGFLKQNSLMTLEAFTKHIAQKAKGKTLSSRLIVVSNDKLLKQTEKVKLARRDNASLFSQQLLLIRRKLKHRGIVLIKPGEKQWLEVKEICELATNFCDEFQINLKDGYRTYCEIGLGLMKNYNLLNFKRLNATIFQRYECIHEIEADKWSDVTELIYLYYLKKVNQKIGWANNIKDDPTKYVYFVKIRKEADSLRIDYKIYIDAQFDGLEWANAIPDPTQMVGVKAIDRLMKYCYKNDIKQNAASEKKIDFSKIKNKHGKKG